MQQLASAAPPLPRLGRSVVGHTRRRAARSLAGAVIALLLLAASASADQLGQAPFACPHLPPVPNCYITGGGGQASASPHVAHVGDLVTIKFTADGSYNGVQPGNIGPPSLQTAPGAASTGLHARGCHNGISAKSNTGVFVCRYRAAVPTRGWVIAQYDFSVNYGGASTTGTFYAVLGKQPVIEGVARDAAQKPVVGAVITIAGSHGHRRAKTDSAGYYHAEVAPGRYRVSALAGAQTFTPDHVQVTARYNKTVEANFGKFDRQVVLVRDPGGPVDRAIVGETLIYDGTGFDPKGGEIVVSLGHKRLKSLSAAASFQGRFKVPTFPEGSCSGQSLRVVQDGDSRVIPLLGHVTQAIAFVRGNVTADHVRRLRRNQAVCDGEHVKVPADGTFVALGLDQRAHDEESSYQYLKVIAPAAGIEQDGGLLAPRLRLSFLHPAVTLTFGPLAFNVASLDTANKPDLVNLTRDTLNHRLDLTGNYRSDRTLTLRGGMVGGNGVLYVAGELKVTGGGVARGRNGGLVAATGAISIKGPVASPGASFVSPQQIELRGR